MKHRSVGHYLCWMLCLIMLGAGGAAQADPGDGLQRLLDGLGRSFGRLGGTYLEPTPGATRFETAIEHRGLGRPVLYIRPEVAAPGKAPAVVMLSYSFTTPQTMANVVRAGRLAAEHGVWVILPTAVLRHWQESPVRRSFADDVGYLTKVIKDAVKRYPIDPDRVYMAGLSNGAYMTTRFVCEQSSLLAGIAVVGATMRTQQVKRCHDNKPLPVFMIAGTHDLLSPYNGRLGLLSVDEVLNYWSERNGCDSAARVDSALPNPVDDGMHTIRTDIQNCASGADIRLLTVVDGGHAWPSGNTFLSDTPFATATQDFSATAKLWAYLSQFSRQPAGAMPSDDDG